MNYIFKIESEDLIQGSILKKSIEIRLTEKQYRVIQEIAIEVDDIFGEILTCIVNKNLLDKLDDKDFKQIAMDAYYEDTFNFE